MCHVTSHVTSRLQKRREENKSVHVTSAPPVSNASDPEAPPTDRPSGPPIKPDAARMVREIIPGNQPTAVKSALRSKASEMLVRGTDPEIVRAALHESMTRTDVGPGILPSLVSGLLKAPRSPERPPNELSRSLSANSPTSNS